LPIITCKKKLKDGGWVALQGCVLYNTKNSSLPPAIGKREALKMCSFNLRKKLYIKSEKSTLNYIFLDRSDLIIF
jgi:hypothetical protein